MKMPARKEAGIFMRERIKGILRLFLKPLMFCKKTAA